jgi:hypothetical protein
VLLYIGQIGRDRIQPMAEKYDHDKNRGERHAHLLADMPFVDGKNDGQLNTSYLVHGTLQSLHTILCFI